MDPQIRWASSKNGKREVWTVDGSALEAVHFFSAIDGGEALFEFDRKQNPPVFRGTMTAHEIMDLFVDSAELLGAARVVARDLKPFAFGGNP